MKATPPLPLKGDAPLALGSRILKSVLKRIIRKSDDTAYGNKPVQSAPLKDKSCDHRNCQCVWCEHGLT